MGSKHRWRAAAGRRHRRGADRPRHALSGRIRATEVPRHAHRASTITPSRPARQVAEELGRLSSNRISGAHGLQGLAAKPPPPRAIVLGHRWDPDCAELRNFLDRNQVSFGGSRPIRRARPTNGAIVSPRREDYPVVRIIDGTTVTRPQLRRLAELLDLGTEPSATEYDAVVVGQVRPAWRGGVRRVWRAGTLVIEREAPGGQAGSSSRIENYLGFPDGVSGAKLAERALKQGRRLGAELLVTRTLTQIDAASHEVHLDGGDVVGAHDHPRLRRLLAPALDRGLRPVGGEGHLLWRRPGRAPDTRAGRPHHRRGQLRGAGGHVLLQLRGA